MYFFIIEIDRSRLQPPKQIKIITIPSDKASGEISPQVKSCVSLNQNSRTLPNPASQKVAPKAATQGFLRVIKGGQVQLVPIRITHGPKGMILTPIEGELASQTTDEMSLKPISTLDKYKDIPIFGPGVEELCTGISSPKEITDALAHTPLQKDDILDFEKVFECPGCTVSQKEFMNLTKQQPVFQRPHDSLFDYRPWSLAEERIVRICYGCQECRIKLDKLTFSENQTVNLRKVLQAQLYCGFDYVSSSEDEMSDDEETLPDCLLDCMEVSIGACTRILPEKVLVPESIQGKSSVADEDENLPSEEDDQTSDTDDNGQSNPKLVRRFKANGVINEPVDPHIDHCYHIRDTTESEGTCPLESREECLYDLSDDDTEAPFNNKQEDDVMCKDTDEIIPDDADICRSVMLDCMDFVDDDPSTETVVDRNRSPVSESRETENFETVSLNSEKNDVVVADRIESPVSERKQTENLETVSVSSEESLVITEDSVSKIEKDYCSDDQYSATTYDSDEFSDTEMDELPSQPRDLHLSSPKDYGAISPIVIVPISDMEYGVCDETDFAEDLNQVNRKEPVATTNHQFAYISENVVGEVNIKTSTDIHATYGAMVDSNVAENVGDQNHWVEDGNLVTPNFETHSTPKSSKVPKKKKRRSSSSESAESKETFKIKLPEKFRHIPILHNYCMLPDGVSYAKREKPPRKRDDSKTGKHGTSKIPKVRRIDPSLPSFPHPGSETKVTKTVSLLNKPSQGVTLKVKDKPTFFFRVSGENKLINFGDLSKIPVSSTLPDTPTTSVTWSTYSTSLLRTDKPQSTAPQIPVPNPSVSAPSMASISADSVSKLTSLLASSESRVTASGTSGTSAPVLSPAVAPVSEKSVPPASRSPSRLIKSILKEDDSGKSQEPKLLSLLKPLNLQPGTKIRLKKVSVGAEPKESSGSSKSVSDSSTEKTELSKSVSPTKPVQRFPGKICKWPSNNSTERKGCNNEYARWSGT